MAQRRTAIERFGPKVRRPDACWEWTAARTRDGYGSFWNGEYINGVPGSPVMVLAHRWAYEQFVGLIPDGLSVLHHCDNPPCVRPDHLFLGTQRVNVHDCIQKGRHRCGQRFLSERERSEVRSLYRGEYGDIMRLAERFGASKYLISDAVRGLPRQGRLAR